MSALHFATRSVWTLRTYLIHSSRATKTQLNMNDDSDEGETQNAEVILVNMST